MSKYTSKIIDYVKENKLYVLVMFLCMMIFAVQMSNIVLYADDLVLGTIADKHSLLEAIKYLKFNYFEWGGGPTPFIAILFMMFDIKVWKLFNCLMIFLTIVLSVRMITYNTKINKALVATVIWICIFLLNIFISRETLYWLDGNLAYMLTTFQVFIYFYYLYSRLVMKTKEKKYDFVLLPIVAFFSGWTGPQTAVLTVIIPFILFIWIKFINKEKIPIIYLISFVFGCIGTLVELLAPGNSVRMTQSFPEFSQYTILEKIFYRTGNVFNLIFNYKIYKIASLPFYTYMIIGILSIISFKYAINEKNNFLSIVIKSVSLGLISFILLNLGFELDILNTEVLKKYIFEFTDLFTEFKNNTLCFKMLIPYIISILVLLSAVSLSFYLSLKKKNPLVVILILCAFLAQGIMVVSPYSPLRSVFITAVLLWISNAYLISISYEENIDVSYAIILTLLIHYFKYGLLFGISVIVFDKLFEKNRDNKSKIICSISLLFISSIFMYGLLISKYSQNEKIYYQNIERINYFKENDIESKELYLLDPVDELYGFDHFVGIDWIENAVRQYFELDSDVKLLRDNSTK